MFRKLVVCTDGSPYGDVACQYGFHLAGALKAELKGLHVLDVRMTEGPYLADLSGAIGATGYYGAVSQFRDVMEAKGNAIQSNFEACSAKAGVPATLKVEIGHPVHSILEVEQDSDLLILGQRGENEKHGRELLGSVTDRVSRSATKPCLITHSQFTPVTSVLAACDGSPISEKVAASAAVLASALMASLTVLTVTEKLDPVVAQGVAEAAARTCKAAGCDPRLTILPGHASDVILDVIARDKTNLVVMGAHAHTRIRRWFVGCTSQRVLADSGIPVLLVR